MQDRQIWSNIKVNEYTKAGDHIRHIIIIVVLAAIVSLIGLRIAKQPQAVSGSYQNISPQEAKRRLDTENGIILLDVRTPAENHEKRIPGSVLIPVDDIEQLALSLLPDKNAVLFVYCRSGRRSVTASLALIKMGYTKVYNLGGIIHWPYETESGAN